MTSDPASDSDPDPDSDRAAAGADEDRSAEHDPPAGDGRADRDNAQHREPRSGRRRPTRRRRILIGLLITTLVLVGVVVGVAWFFSERYLGDVDRIAGVFDGLDESERPAPSPIGPDGERPLTFLLIGSDDPYIGLEGEDQVATRSDAIMLMRISSDRRQVEFVSIPRDSWVHVPGRGMQKINQSYAVGGPALLVRTVEALTDIRIDHFAAIDVFDVAPLTDALGGVDVYVAETVAVGRTVFEAGLNHLDGDEARVYLSQRYGLPRGDLDRIQRQQSYLRAVVRTILTQDLLNDLGRTDDLLVALTDFLSVDDTLSNFDMLNLAYELRGVTADTISFFTAPVDGRGREGVIDVLYLDGDRCERLWTYLREGTLSEHAAEFSDQELPAIPR